MMQRNVVVKKAPQRFQDEKDLSKIDICICFDDRVFDAVLESMAPCCFWSVDLQFRACHGMKPLLVLNMHTQDKPAMAEEGAHYALRLATMVRSELKGLWVVEQMPRSWAGSVWHQEAVWSRNGTVSIVQSILHMMVYLFLQTHPIPRMSVKGCDRRDVNQKIDPKWKLFKRET